MHRRKEPEIKFKRSKMLQGPGASEGEATSLGFTFLQPGRPCYNLEDLPDAVFFGLEVAAVPVRHHSAEQLNQCRLEVPFALLVRANGFEAV